LSCELIETLHKIADKCDVKAIACLEKCLSPIAPVQVIAAAIEALEALAQSDTSRSGVVAALCSCLEGHKSTPHDATGIITRLLQAVSKVSGPNDGTAKNVVCSLLEHPDVNIRPHVLQCLCKLEGIPI